MAQRKTHLYFDYAAGTPIDPRVFKAMRPYLGHKFGNPGSLHFFGQEAISAVDKSREIIANSIGAEFREIIFTASATEANNLILRGTVKNYLRRGGKNPHLIVSSIEHESILETAKDLKKEGAKISIVPVNKDGSLNKEKLFEFITPQTIVVSIMYGNNEIGYVEPIWEIGQKIKEKRGKNIYPIFHTDAAQAFQFLESSPRALEVDSMTISSHKIYGPKGAACLFISKEKRDYLDTLITGGGQEFKFRSGTENVPAIVGFGEAIKIISGEREKINKYVAELSKYTLGELKKIVPNLTVNGSLENKLPHILNVRLPGFSSEDLLTKLDLQGIAVSAGSACAARSLEPSHVLSAMGLLEKNIKESLRISLGRTTTKKEIDKFMLVVNNVVKSK